jgi:hypothetical protein
MPSAGKTLTFAVYQQSHHARVLKRAHGQT